MSTFQASDQESTALETPRHVPLGTDAAGYDHHHAATDDLVWVFDGSELVRVVDLTADDADFADWIGTVRRERGWTDLTTAAVLASAFGGP